MGIEVEQGAERAGRVGASSGSENGGLTRGQKLRFALLVLALFVAVPILLGHSPYFITVLTNAAILSFISLGVWITFSIGRMNLAQGAFALVGGYASAILATRYGVSFWLCLPLSGLVSSALGALIGWPVLRLKGVYFAMTTLSLTEAIRLLALNGGDLTKGATGIVNIPRPGAIKIFGSDDRPGIQRGRSAAFLFPGLRAIGARIGRGMATIDQSPRMGVSIASSKRRSGDLHRYQCGKISGHCFCRLLFYGGNRGRIFFRFSSEYLSRYLYHRGLGQFHALLLSRRSLLHFRSGGWGVPASHCFRAIARGPGLSGAHLWGLDDRLHALAAERHLESWPASR